MQNTTVLARTALEAIKSRPGCYGLNTWALCLCGKNLEITHRHGLDKHAFFGSFKELSLTDTKNFLMALIKQGLLTRIETEERIYVLDITANGEQSLASNAPIEVLEYKQCFQSGAEISQQFTDLLDVYAVAKEKLDELEKEVNGFKEKIKQEMMQKQLNRAESIKCFVELKEKERIFYPKRLLEEFVPEEHLEKARKTQQVTVLLTRFKAKNLFSDDKNQPKSL